MERAVGFAHDDTPQARLDKLDALLAQTSTSKQDAALFADMLSLPNDGRYPTIDLTPEQRRRNTLEALGLQVEILSRSNPVLMIFEDAHWTDPTSLEAFVGRAHCSAPQCPANVPLRPLRSTDAPAPLRPWSPARHTL
jgi:predicted ATPase